MDKTSDRPKRTRRAVVAEETSEQTAAPRRNRNEQTSPDPSPRRRRKSTRRQAGDNASDDAASTRFEAEFVFPSVFFRGGARRAPERKVRDVASLAVLLDASKRFFANLCEIVRKFDRR